MTQAISRRDLFKNVGLGAVAVAGAATVAKAAAIPKSPTYDFGNVVWVDGERGPHHCSRIDGFYTNTDRVSPPLVMTEKESDEFQEQWLAAFEARGELV